MRIVALYIPMHLVCRLAVPHISMYLKGKQGVRRLNQKNLMHHGRRPVKVERSEAKRRRNTFAVRTVPATLDSVVEHRKTTVIDYNLLIGGVPASIRFGSSLFSRRGCFPIHALTLRFAATHTYRLNRRPLSSKLMETPGRRAVNFLSTTQHKQCLSCEFSRAVDTRKSAYY